VREKKITKKQSIDSIKNFFNALERLSPGDMFCLKGSNPVFSKKELSSELKGIIFNKADEEARKIIPRLGVSLDSLIWSEYYDIFIAAGMDIQGPFVLENGRILVIKDFFDLKPVEIWDSVKEFPAKRIRLFLKYNPIDLKIDYLLHETSSQPLSQNLFEWAVEMTDSKGKKTFLSSEDIPELTAKALEIVSKQTDFVNSLPRLEQIRKGAEICYYQSKELREFFNSSWKPPKEVFQAIESKGLEVWEKFDWKKKHDEHSSKADWIKRYDPREKL
jgi:hypothetical protein